MAKRISLSRQAWLLSAGVPALVATLVPAPASVAPPLADGSNLPSTCTAQDASLNTAAPPYKELVADFLPVGIGGDCFFVTYSTRENSSGVNNNVTVSIFELLDGRVLLFGSGYGDLPVAANSAAADAAVVDDVIRNCLSLDDTNLVFVVPHGHPDHFNPAFVHELENLGHTFDELWVHAGDLAAVQNPNPQLEPWDPDEIPLIQSFGDMRSTCESSPRDPNTVHFATTIGTIYFSHRPGHTDGAVDLILQHGSGFYIMYGSGPPGMFGSSSCDTATPYINAIQTWEAHGNVVYQ